MRLKSSSGHKSSDIFSKSEQMSLKKICFKILYRHILKVSMPSECQTSYNTLKSLFHHLCKWCEQCAYNIDSNSFHIIAFFSWVQRASFFHLKLPLSIKNSSENVPYFWNCFVFTLLKNCAMLFAGGENRCLWMVRS